jgi:hypothetical protein
MIGTVPDGWRVTDGVVPLADVARSAEALGVSYEAVSAAARSGLLPVARTGGQGGARHITLDNALLVLAAVALAVAGGAAFAMMLRAIRETDATVTPGGLTIRFPQVA